MLWCNSSKGVKAINILKSNFSSLLENLQLNHFNSLGSLEYSTQSEFYCRGSTDYWRGLKITTDHRSVTEIGNDSLQICEGYPLVTSGTIFVPDRCIFGMIIQHRFDTEFHCRFTADCNWSHCTELLLCISLDSLQSADRYMLYCTNLSCILTCRYPPHTVEFAIYSLKCSQGVTYGQIDMKWGLFRMNFLYSRSSFEWNLAERNTK